MHCKISATVILLIALLIFFKTAPSTANPCPNFWSEFEAAKEYYYEGDWNACFEHGEKAVAGFAHYKRSILTCVEQCTKVNNESRSAVWLASYLLHSLTISSCLDQCAENRVSAEIWKTFISREPYDYLQMCYYKAGKMTAAVKAAVTFTVANPTHSYMLGNIETYREVYNISEEHFIDIQAANYQKNYKLAQQACISSQPNCSSLMRITLADYIQSYNECILLCDIRTTGKTSEGQLQFTYTIVTDLLKRVVQCKSRCLPSLNRLDLNSKPDMLYNILYTLYSTSEIDEDWVTSLKYLDTLISLSRSKIQALREGLLDQPLNELRSTLVLKIENDETLESKPFEGLINFINKVNEIEDIMTELKRREYNSHKTKLDKEFSSRGIQVTRAGSELSGDERFVADNFISRQECETLTDLCKVHGMNGDGYDSDTPHTKHETFRGLSLPATMKLVEEGKVSLDHLILYINVSETLKSYVQYFFNTDQLYFHYTHLVCRIAIDGDIERTDLSHPVHADNCIFIEGDQCYKQAPAYTQRDYSGILYLNEEFRGGEFFFADEHGHEQALVKPACGRFVGFDGGSLHGVKALTRGQRCAVAIWLTLDESSAEVSRKKAADYITSQMRENKHRDEL